MSSGGGGVIQKYCKHILLSPKVNLKERFTQNCSSRRCTSIN